MKEIIKPMAFTIAVFAVIGALVWNVESDKRKRDAAQIVWADTFKLVSTRTTRSFIFFKKTRRQKQIGRILPLAWGLTSQECEIKAEPYRTPGMIEAGLGAICDREQQGESEKYTRWNKEAADRAIADAKKTRVLYAVFDNGEYKIPVEVQLTQSKCFTEKRRYEQELESRSVFDRPLGLEYRCETYE